MGNLSTSFWYDFNHSNFLRIDVFLPDCYFLLFACYNKIFELNNIIFLTLKLIIYHSIHLSLKSIQFLYFIKKILYKTAHNWFFISCLVMRIKISNKSMYDFKEYLILRICPFNLELWIKNVQRIIKNLLLFRILSS
jgi:hypothetical protein